MEEEDEMSLLDLRSPKGQLIKVLEQKIKKPEIDDSLGKALDQFSQLTKEQTTFLENGIFHMNFAEDALLLQACGQLYAKRVDKLWDELLQFHTRLVKYDEHAAKHCTDGEKRDARKQEVAKLEERLNRGKRKKICLTEPEAVEAPIGGEYLFPIDSEEIREVFGSRTFPFPQEDDNRPEPPPVSVPFEYDNGTFSRWKAINRVTHDEAHMNFNSLFVSHYHWLRYRFRHYTSPYSAEAVYDVEDPEEFNTREGRLISSHYIRHLFDDNDKCLIPDEGFTIAKLRLAYVMRKKWLYRNNIKPGDFENHLEAWQKYRREFVEHECRKIQNMPQSTPDQLMTFYKALARKEELAIEKVEKLKAQGVKNLPIVCFESVIVAPTKDGYEGIFDSYIPEGFECPKPPSEFYVEENRGNATDGVQVTESSASTQSTDQVGNHGSESQEAESSTLPGNSTQYQNNTEETHDNGNDAELTSLLGNMPQDPDHSPAEDNDKARSDSGYFDGGFADDDSVCDDRSEAPMAGTETPFEFDKDTSADKEGDADQAETSTADDSTPETDAANLSVDETGTGRNNVIVITDYILNGVELAATGHESTQYSPTREMNEGLRRLCNDAAEDHQESIYNALENSYFDDSNGLITIVYNKTKPEKTKQTLAKKKVEKEAASENSADVTPKTRKREQQQLVVCPPKRRRLSKKQIEKLKKSIIAPTREMKWEYFYSLNYQPESGEGEVKRFDWETDFEEDEDLFDEDEDACLGTDFGAEDHPNNNSDDRQDEGEDCEETECLVRSSQDSGIGMDQCVSELANGTTPEGQVDVTVADTQGDKVSNMTVTEPPLSDFFAAELAQIQASRKEPASEADYMADMTPHERESEMSRLRVEEWREHMTKKLKKLDEHDFDIHEYGANMMDRMTTNERLPFGEFVQGKSSSEVVRYFVSSLQLANTLNVEICGVKQGELSNDSFELKLLSKERYHEHLQEYQAPSEETLRDKLIKIKEIRQQNKILKTNQSSKRHGESTKRKVVKKVRILNYEVVRPRERRSIDFQQPCSSQQADEFERQNSIDSYISDFTQAPNRVSIDSGFMPACDEEFLEEFDQLQSISDENLQSTPIKPRMKSGQMSAQKGSSNI